MKTSFFKSPKAQKWGLFCLLAGALACDLSLNPQTTQHFGADFASSQTPEQITVKKQITQVSVKNETYNVTVLDFGDHTEARFSKVIDPRSKTEADAGTCPQLCGQSRVLTSSISDMDKLTKELTDIVKDAQSKVNEVANTDTDSGDAKPQKAGHATKVDIAEWSKKCDNMKKDDNLECQKIRLVDLSKYLADEENQGKTVEKYFKKFVQPGMSRKLKSPVVKLHAGTYEQDDEALSDMDDMAAKLMSDLRDTNGERTRKAIAQMLAKSYSQQMHTAQDMIRNGQSTGNRMEVYAGMNALNPNYWGQRLNDQYDNLTTSVDEDVQDMIDQTLSQPVTNMLTQMATAARASLSQPLQVPKLPDGMMSPCISICQAYANFNIPDLGNVGTGSDMGLVGVISDASTLQARGNQRGSAITSAPWINNTQVQQQGQVGQACAIGNIHSPSTGECVPQSSVPGAYQPSIIGQQPSIIGQPGLVQPNYMQPGVMQPGVLQRPGIIQQPGGGGTTIRSSGRSVM